MIRKDWATFIPDSSANRAIAAWHNTQPERVQKVASPSTLTECPRVVWLRYKKHVPITAPLTWGKAQRLLLGRNFENQIALQYKKAGQLLWHWQDFDPGMAPKRVNGKKTSEYTAWINMKMRCYNLNDRCYSEYGGRGITVCDRWRESYENFMEDMGAKPDPSYSLDRKNNEYNYTLENCRWASPTTQARNQRANNESGVRGVYFDKASSTWRAHIKVAGIDNFLGSFKDKQDAISARQEGEKLLWKDDVPGESVRFGMGNGLERIEGTPDLLLSIDGNVAISDAKTSRADSFGYVPLKAEEAFQDPFWHKYKLQVTAYYMLCHQNKEWFAAPYIGEGDFKESVSGKHLPLPNICHLFSFALDDGVVRREFAWKPTAADAQEVLHYARRWNTGYASETMPDCTCNENKGTMFCCYGSVFETTRKGATLAIKCCEDSLIESVRGKGI